MANNVTNTVHFIGKDSSEFISRFFTDTSIFDFNKIIPCPDDIFQGDVGEEERQKYGEKTWYDWNPENWGTKWNSYNCTITKYKNGNCKVKFQTAWTEPVPIINRLKALCLEEKLEVSFKWCCQQEWESKIYMTYKSKKYQRKKIKCKI